MTEIKFQSKYRIPSARANWHAYDGGMYFVTICTKDKVHYFGKIVDGEMCLNGLGYECARQIEITSEMRPDIDITIPIYVVMPNHTHLIVCIDAPRRDAMPCVSKIDEPNESAEYCEKRDAKHGVSTEPGNKFQPQSKNLASIIRGIKSAVTIYARKNNIPFDWQTRFHDRIIRNKEECNKIAEYIENNPINWMLDELNIQQHRMKKNFIFAAIALLAIACTPKHSAATVEETDYTKYVNPFIGNAFTGHTFPGATYPLGLVQPGPETGNYTWEYCSGYVYEDTHISGFSQTRLNGTGCVDLGDLLMQPFSGDKRDDLRSRYDKTSEKASPGYYAVKLTDNNVNVQITAAPHVAFHKYTFAKGKPANLLTDFQSGLTWTEDKVYRHILDNEITFENDSTISGFTRRTEWVERTYFFVIKFDKPIINKEELPKRDAREKAPRYILTFDMQNGADLNMKIALSSTSVDAAKTNMTAEVSGWDFNAVHTAAVNEWNNYLSRVKVEGTDDEKTNFYTSMYHLFIQPNNLADVDGKYIGPNRNISQASGGKYYSTLSQWDTFRAAFPMYTILSPEMIPDMVNSMLDFSQQQGHLPIWALWGQETYTMIGNHSVPMIVDAYLKGFKGFDAERAYNEIKKSITESKHPKSDWEVYDKYGYYPYDLVQLESVSRTLECGFDDYCAALLAQKLGKQADADFFMKRANYYKNLLDKETNAMRPKNSKGEWMTPFDPYELAHADSQVGGHYTEGNALQYTWHVLQDIPGLIEQMGGKEKAAKTLDYLFNTAKESTGTLSDVTGLIGQYAHGNEPSHHVAYIYSYLDRPEETQRLVRQICTDFYKNKPDGLIGNDDCGQMSAWYMFSSLGFYPMNPVSGEFVLGAPQVPSASINVGNGKWFTMEARNLSKENMYVEKIELNGKPYDKKFITYQDIMNGGALVFYMGDAKQRSTTE